MDNLEKTSRGSVRHSFVGKKGDLRCELHYKDFGAIDPTCTYHGVEAALYVFKASAPAKGIFIPMCKMWAFTYDPMGAKGEQIDGVRTGDKVAARAREIGKVLYGVVTQSDEFRILDLLCDYLEELKNHRPPPGMDKTLDGFLAECDEEGLEFFLEINGEKVHLG